MSEWADRNRRLSAEASAEPGKWDTSRAEYQRGIMDAVSDPTVESVVVMSSAQVGKTEIINNVIGFHIDQDPAPMLLLQPTLEMALAWSKDRLAPMLRDTPALAGKVADARARDSGNTLLHKTFPGGHITMAGANSPASLASRPIRIVLADEVDRFPVSAGSEGDPVSLAKKRSTTFWNRKLVLVSTPTIAGSSRIETAYEASDQRRYFVPCQHCGEAQALDWANVKWVDPADAAYCCAECGVLWTDAERWQAIRKGEWRGTAEFAGTAGFALSELYSPWVRLSEMVRSFLAAKGHPEMLKTWINTSLGQTWRDKGEAPDWEILAGRREDREPGSVPAGGLFLTAGADVQKDRIEVSVWAWGRGRESWLVEHRVIDGDTSRPEVWERLSELLSDTWAHESGVEMGLQRMAVDSGYATQEVYAWARGRPNVMVIKGRDSGAAAVGTPTAVDVTTGGRKIKRGAKLWPVCVSMLKSQLYGWLRQVRPDEGADDFPPGYVHLPRIGEEYIKQLCAEQLVTLKNGRREWQKLRDRNEALDCRVYAHAAAIAVGLDRFAEKHWKGFEHQLIPPDEPAQVITKAAPRGAVSVSGAKLRVIQSGYMSS